MNGRDVTVKHFLNYLPGGAIFRTGQDGVDIIGISSIPDTSGNGNDLSVFGYTATWSGAETATLFEPVILADAEPIVIRFSAGSALTGYKTLLGKSDNSGVFVRPISATQIQVCDGTNPALIYTVPALSTDTDYTLTLSLSGSDLSLNVNGGGQTKTLLGPLTFDTIGKSSGNAGWVGKIYSVQIGGDLLTFESGNTQVQKIVIGSSGIVRAAMDTDLIFTTKKLGAYYSSGGREIYTDETELINLDNIGVPVGFDNTTEVTAANALLLTAGTSAVRGYINISTVPGQKYYFVISANLYTTDIYLYIRDGVNGAGTVIAQSTLVASGSSNSVKEIEFTATSSTTTILTVSDAGYNLNNISCRAIVDGLIPAGSYVTGPYQYTGKIVCIGDSMTGGNYPLILAKIYPNATIVDAGVTGDTVAQMLARLPTLLTTHSPDYVYYFGIANSIAAGSSFETISGQISSMISLATAAGSRFVIGTPTPCAAAGEPYYSASKQLIIEAVRDWIINDLTGVWAKANLYETLRTPGADTLHTLYEYDDLHPNTLGDVVITNTFITANPLSDSAFRTFNSIFDAPDGVAVLNAPTDAELIAADAGDLLWFDGVGAAKDVAPSAVLASRGDATWGGYNGSRAEIAVYDPASVSVEANARIDRYFSRRYD